MYTNDNVIFNDDMSYGWPNKVNSYITKNITECIHDGVTTFIVTDEHVKHIRLEN